jgi:hypothetical protein
MTSLLQRERLALRRAHVDETTYSVVSLKNGARETETHRGWHITATCLASN